MAASSQQVQIVKIGVVHIICRFKCGSGLPPSKEPLWFKHMDPGFIETNAEIVLSHSTLEISFVQDDGEAKFRFCKPPGRSAGK